MIQILTTNKGHEFSIETVTCKHILLKKISNGKFYVVSPAIDNVLNEAGTNEPLKRCGYIELGTLRKLLK